jgi:hypothetical protein
MSRNDGAEFNRTNRYKELSEIYLSPPRPTLQVSPDLVPVLSPRPGGLCH